MNYKLIGKDVASLATVFSNRGIGMEILNANEKHLHDPFLMKNMEEAITLVNKHVDNKSRFIIQQDPDADGYTSTSLLVQYLKRLGVQKISVMIQPNKEHGINIELLEELLEDFEYSKETADNFIVIAPDASSNEHDIHKKVAIDKGIDVLVLDHHEAESYSPYATMVNPSLDDYPNKNISGVGVVQKFAKAYDIRYGYDFSDDYYDLVAVGMIADMIELTTTETVYMVQRGMREINNSFLKALYKKQDYSIKGIISPTKISFYIAPLINATTRAATLEEKRIITDAMLTNEPILIPSTKRGAREGDTEDIHENAVRLMTNIKSRQGREVDKALNLVEEIIKEKDLNKHKLLIVDYEGKFNKSYTGLIANKLMGELQKPVLIGKVGEDDILSGSGRTYDKSALADLRGFLSESGIVDYAEGHAAAHGFGVKIDKVPELLDYADKKLEGISFDPIHRLDFIIDYPQMNQMHLNLLDTIAKMDSYWGRGFEIPVFMIKDLPVAKKDVEITGDFGRQTLKINTPHFTALAFRLSDEKVEKFVNNEQNTVDLIATASISEYRGRKSLTLFMNDFEIKRSAKYFF